MGVDVGGRRKGFDVAVVGAGRVLELAGRLSCADVVGLVRRHRPRVVGIDSPRSCAPPGAASRESERLLARSVCGIRYTPDAARVNDGGYYEWIVEGLRLHRALERECTVIEVFPTASFTLWHGERGRRPRSQWTREALAGLRLAGVPARANQDQRDAIAAAVTAQQHSAGLTERLGEIVVPMRAYARQHAPQNAMDDPGEIARFYDRASDLMRELLDALAEAPDRPRPFLEIEDAIGWPRRRIASVLGGVSQLRHTEFAGRRPYRFYDDRQSASGRWEMWMDAAQAGAVRAARRG